VDAVSWPGADTRWHLLKDFHPAHYPLSPYFSFNSGKRRICSPLLSPSPVGPRSYLLRRRRCQRTFSRPPPPKIDLRGKFFSKGPFCSVRAMADQHRHCNSNGPLPITPDTHPVVSGTYLHVFPPGQPTPWRLPLRDAGVLLDATESLHLVLTAIATPQSSRSHVFPPGGDRDVRLERGRFDRRECSLILPKP